MSSPSAQGPMRFGVFEFDSRSLELRKAGSKVRLEGQPLRVLHLLLERRGEMVTREELRDTLWKRDTFVSSEQGINNCIRRLREVLGDSAQTPRFIETLPRRGYRFIYPIPADTESLPADRPRPMLALAALAVVILGATAASIPSLRRDPLRTGSSLHSIAIVPFANLTGDPEQQYLVDGLQDQLIASLARIRSLEVSSRLSVAPYRNQPVRRIGRDLGVDAVMQASVQRVDNRYLVSVRLTDTHSERQLWAHAFHYDEQHSPSFSSTIALALARDFAIPLAAPEEAALHADAGMAPAVFKAFFKGNYFQAKRTRENLKKAIDFYHEALDLDPTFAPAWNGIAGCYVQMGHFYFLAPDDAWPKAEVAAKKALELDSSLAEAHKTLGLIRLYYYRDWDGAQREAAIAKSLDPEWPGDSFTAVTGGRFEEGIAIAKAAVARNPLSLDANLQLGWSYFQAGRYDDSIAQLQKTLEIDRMSPYLYTYLSWNYVKKGECQKAISACTQAVGLQQQRGDLALGPGGFRCGWVYASCGRHAEARLTLQENDDIRRQGQRWVNPGAGALLYDAMGDHERAISLMWKEYESHVSHLEYVVCRMCSDALKADPRMQELRRRLGPQGPKGFADKLQVQ